MILTFGVILEVNKHWKYYLTLNDNSSFTWRILGNTSLNLGDRAKALSSYKEALRIKPHDEKAKIAISKLVDEKM